MKFWVNSKTTYKNQRTLKLCRQHGWRPINTFHPLYKSKITKALFWLIYFLIKAGLVLVEDTIPIMASCFTRTQKFRRVLSKGGSRIHSSLLLLNWWGTMNQKLTRNDKLSLFRPKMLAMLGRFQSLAHSRRPKISRRPVNLALGSRRLWRCRN